MAEKTKTTEKAVEGATTMKKMEIERIKGSDSLARINNVDVKTLQFAKEINPKHLEYVDEETKQTIYRIDLQTSEPSYLKPFALAINTKDVKDGVVIVSYKTKADLVAFVKYANATLFAAKAEADSFESLYSGIKEA